jgi:hypothetical protein
VRRIAWVLAIGVLLLAFGAALLIPGGEERPASVDHAALIDLPGLFGDENEPDENEQEEGKEGAPARESSGPSLLGVMFLVLLALIAARFALFYFRVRRRVRNEGWLALLVPRRPPARGWAEDRIDRRRPPRERRRRSG